VGTKIEGAPDQFEERYIQILSSAADAIVTIDEQQRIAIFNAGAEDMFGYSASEVIGQPLVMLLPPESAAVHEREVEAFAKSARGSRRMAERRPIFGRRKTGEVFPAEASISRVEVAGQRWFTAVVRDVGERWAAEQEKAALLTTAQRARDAAEEARRRLAFLAEVSLRLDASLDIERTLASLADLLVPSLGVLCWLELRDEHGQARPVGARHADPAKTDLAEALLRYSGNPKGPYVSWRVAQTGAPLVVEDLAPESLAEYAQDDDHLELLRRVAPRAFVSVPMNTRGMTLGAITVVRDASMPRFGSDDLSLVSEIARRAALAVDNAQLYWRAQHALRQRDETLAIVSHDLRNPLTAITMVVAALEHPAARAEEGGRLIAMIRRSAHLMRRMIDDLHDVASIESGRLAIDLIPVSPARVFTQALQLFEGTAAERSIRLRAEVPESLPLVRADADRLAQVLSNLVSNAIKFTAPGGEVAVDARAVDHELHVRIRDTGPGISPDELPLVFDRFWRGQRGTVARGTGLGLAIAKGLVEAHRGRIWAESTLGRGSTFTFTIPTAQPGS
jgi:PAS domain S-box-containing protein